MKPKTTLILFIILIVVIAVYYIQKEISTSHEKATEEAKKLFSFKQEQVRRVHLENGKSQFVFQKEGDVWEITDPVQIKADKTEINSLISTIENAQIGRVVADSVAQLAPFGLQPAQAKLIFNYEEGKADTLFIGKKNATGSNTYVRVNNQSRVLLTSTSVSRSVDKKLFDFRDKTILEFNKNNVQQVTLDAKNKRYMIHKQGDQWQITYPRLLRADETEIDKILNKLDTDKATEFVAEKPASLSEYGLNHPSYQIELLLAPDSVKKRLLIGAQKGDDYFAKDETRQPVFIVKKSFVETLNTNLFALRDKKVLDFDRNTLTKIKLTYDDSTVVCQKDTAGNWLITAPDSAKAKSWRIRSLLAALQKLKTEKFVNENTTNLQPYGLQQPSNIVTLIDKQEQVSDILYIGKATDENTFVTNKNKKAVFQVINANLSNVKIKLKDLIEKDE